MHTRLPEGHVNVPLGAGARAHLVSKSSVQHAGLT